MRSYAGASKSLPEDGGYGKPLNGACVRHCRPFGSLVDEDSQLTTGYKSLGLHNWIELIPTAKWRTDCQYRDDNEGVSIVWQVANQVAWLDHKGAVATDRLIGEVILADPTHVTSMPILSLAKF